MVKKKEVKIPPQSSTEKQAFLLQWKVLGAFQTITNKVMSSTSAAGQSGIPGQNRPIHWSQTRAEDKEIIVALSCTFKPFLLFSTKLIIKSRVYVVLLINCILSITAHRRNHASFLSCVINSMHECKLLRIWIVGSSRWCSRRVMCLFISTSTYIIMHIAGLTS